MVLQWLYQLENGGFTGSHGPFLYMNYDDLPFLRMLVFHSYVELPEGRGILTTRTTLNGDN